MHSKKIMLSEDLYSDLMHCGIIVISLPVHNALKRSITWLDVLWYHCELTS